YSRTSGSKIEFPLGDGLLDAWGRGNSETTPSRCFRKSRTSPPHLLLADPFRNRDGGCTPSARPSTRSESRVSSARCNLNRLTNPTHSVGRPSGSERQSTSLGVLSLML